MGALPGLAWRMLLTAAGWAVGGYLLGGWFAGVFEGGFRPLRLLEYATDPGWMPYAAGGGALFSLAAAALRSSGGANGSTVGNRVSTSRRGLAVVGAVAMLVVLLVVDWRLTGEALAVVGGAPWLVWSALLQGVVLGWVTLAVGGARE